MIRVTNWVKRLNSNTKKVEAIISPITYAGASGLDGAISFDFCIVDPEQDRGLHFTIDQDGLNDLKALIKFCEQRAEMIEERRTRARFKGLRILP